MRFADHERTEGREARRAFVQLIPRKKDVLEILAEGMGDKEISAPGLASQEGRSAALRHGHAPEAGRQLSRLRALVFAVRHGFIRIGPERGGVALDEEDL